MLEVEKGLSSGRLHNIFSHSQEGRSPGEHHSRKSTEEKVEKDVLIATLSSDTIRWIKRRRMFEAKHRVAITHFRGSQLREIFVGLDFEDENVIDMDELKTRLITPRSSSRASVDRPSTA